MEAATAHRWNDGSGETSRHRHADVSATAKPRLLALLFSPAMRSRLLAAAALWQERRSSPAVTFVDGWPELHHLTRRSPPTIAVVDPCHHSGRLEFEELLSFRTAFPSTIVLPYGALDRCTPSDILRLADLGIHQVITHGTCDDPRTLCGTLRTLFDDRWIEEMLPMLGGWLQPSGVAILRQAIQLHTPLSPSRLAQACRCHPATLRRQLAQEGLPSLERFLGWCQLLVAAHILSDPGRTLTDAALACSCSSAANLANRFRRYTGLPARNIQLRGGAAFVLACLRKECVAPHRDESVILQQAE